MLLSYLDRTSSGGNTCPCVCRVQSRHGNLDLIKEMGKDKGEREMAPLSLRVLMHTFLCALLQHACECVNA